MYTCPMHPEVRSDRPGRCPKCGMALVLQGENPAVSAPATMPQSQERGLGLLTWKNYLPLAVIVALIIIAALTASTGVSGPGVFSVRRFIGYVMTGFFLVFGGFKLLDLKGFAEGYRTYDLLAQKIFAYGYAYPFIELGFGFSMLAGISHPLLLWTECAVMSFSGLGVLIKIMRREPVKCVCLGTLLQVPLTTVTLVEDFGMVALALILLAR